MTQKRERSERRGGERREKRKKSGEKRDRQ
jgi:hypothetical protein